MSSLASSAERLGAKEMLTVLARWFLGAVFIYMGLNKVLHPVEFLKLLREYDVLHHYLALNLVTAALPWFEVFCGLLLVFGVAVRGAAVMLAGMLISFTVLVLLRALSMHESSGLPFCSIKFDCGCGLGEVVICRKLLENLVLTVLSVSLIFWSSARFCSRHSIFQTVCEADPA